jgi:hypothetical protein
MLVGLLGAGRAAAAPTPTFSVGAAVADITPPLYKRATNPAECDPTGFFDGYRKFNFEEPYKDINGAGQYEVGDPYLDCDHNGRYDGIFITSGGRQNAVVKDPIEARAFVVSNGRRKIAVEVIDSIGIFNVEMDAIRAQVRQELRARGDPSSFDEIFISSTHDESAPDPVGLWGPSSGVSGVDDYYMKFLAQQGAQAILRADAARQPAHIRYAQVEQPSRFQTCFSSYPYVQDRLVHILQAVDAVTNRPIVTVSNYGIHAETMAFSPDPVENQYISADWPHFERAMLDRDLGGVSIHMAGPVGSVETPRVFDAVSPTPTGVEHPSHPADCHTTDTGLGSLVPLGYDNETRAVGEALAQTVEGALATRAVWATGNDISAARERFAQPLRNLLFLGVAPIGLFAQRPLCVNGMPMPVAPNGSTVGTDLCTEVAVYTIGDAEFMSVPGEVFPYVLLRGFQGPEDMPFPNEQMSPWVMPHASKPFRFIEGLGEDMLGYLFSQNNATGVPEAEPQRGAYLPQDDRFGCSHDDDSEAASGNAGTIVADHLIHLLAQVGTDPRQRIRVGRYVISSGALSRNPIGTGALRCDAAGRAFTPDPNGGAVAIRVWAPDGSSRTITPGGFIDSGGRPQAHPDMSTRGVWVRSAGERTFKEGVSRRIWLDVFPAVP